MAPDQMGRFCGHCHRTVIDFTAMTDAEVVRTMAQQTGKTCGRFRSDQLDRPLRSETLPSGHRPFVSLLTAGLLSLQGIDTNAQATGSEAIPIQETPARVTSQSQPTVPTSPVSADSLIVITGRVVAGTDGSVLPGVSVMIKGTSQGASTDTAGTFRLTIPAEQLLNPVILGVSYIGFIHQEVVVKSNQGHPLVISLSEDTVALGEVIVIGYAVKKPSFWQRLRNQLRTNH